MSDENHLIRECIKKDRKAQYELYRKYYSFMLSICIRYVHDKEEAASLMNTGFMKILTNLEKYREEVPFELWIRKIMINTLIDDYRKKEKMKSKMEIKELDEKKVDETVSVLNMAVRMMNLEQLHLFISRLPASSQKVFNLYVIDGFTHPEIAAMLNISEGTSKWYLSTARHTLQEMILNFNKVFK